MLKQFSQVVLHGNWSVDNFLYGKSGGLVVFCHMLTLGKNLISKIIRLHMKPDPVNKLDGLTYKLRFDAFL